MARFATRNLFSDVAMSFTTSRPHPSHPLNSVPGQALAFRIKVRLSRDLLEFGGIKSTHGFGVDVTQGGELGDATQNLLFLPA